MTMSKKKPASRRPKTTKTAKPRVATLSAAQSKSLNAAVTRYVKYLKNRSLHPERKYKAPMLKIPMLTAVEQKAFTKRLETEVKKASRQGGGPEVIGVDDVVLAIVANVVGNIIGNVIAKKVAS